VGTLDQKTVIVTGGAGDLGRAYCLALAGEGAQVVVADLADPSQVVSEITAIGNTAIGITVDVSDPASVDKLAATTLETFGHIDVLINNAGLFKNVTAGPFEDIEPEEWDRVMAVNVRGAWLCARAVVPAMRQQGSGRIINVSSNTVWKGVTGFLHYVTSKSAMLGFTRGLAREVGEDGITVNTIAPDYIPDEVLHDKYPGRDDTVVSLRSIPRTQTPEDLVGTVIFLAGPGAAFITGQCLLINGGSIFH